MGRLLISTNSINWKELSLLLSSACRISLSSDAKSSIKTSNIVLNQILQSNKKVYGVNTGFGKLSNVSISSNDIKDLQLNLVRSHACGVGKTLDLGVTRVSMVLKLMTWAKGYSGIRPVLAKLLSLASLQGMADLLTGEGIRFSEFEIDFTSEGKMISILINCVF